MEFTKNNKRNLRVIISETVMVLAVIVTVTVLAFVVSGYWINSDFKVERQGMLQISSLPTGANITIDSEPSSWLQRTNTSKVLSSGKHTVTLTKTGYDSWSKTVNIQEGLLYRLHYPRLFFEERTADKAFDTTGTIAAFISPSRNAIVLANATTKWQYLNLESDQIEPRSIDIANLFVNNSSDDIFSGKILTTKWDQDAIHILLQVKYDDATEWVLLDTKNPAHSLNLTKEFESSFDTVEIIDNSSNNLLVTENGNLRRIDIPNHSISSIIAKNVTSLDHYNNEIVFTALSIDDSPDTNPSSNADDDISTPDTAPYYIGFFKLGDTTPTALLHTATPVKVTLSKFYDDKYLTVLSENVVNVYKYDDLSEFAHYNLSFSPESIKVGHDGEFITMFTGSQLATIDMEANALREWKPEGDVFNWLDNDMIYTVKNGELITYDFDGMNRRSLANNVSSHLPAGITGDKWLYYFSDDFLMREWIIEH